MRLTCCYRSNDTSKIVKDNGGDFLNKGTNINLLYRIAKFYYEDKKTQQEIAEIENISRSQISRLLAKAFDCGIVEYHIAFPKPIDVDMIEKRIRQDLGLRKVILIPSQIEGNSILEEDERVHNLSLGAINHISTLLANYSHIGVGWGRSIYLTSLHLPYQKARKDVSFIPLVGLSGNNNPNLQINIIVDRLSEKFRAKSIYINLVALREMGPLNYNEEKQLEILRNNWSKIDAAIIGIGYPPKQSRTLINEFSENYTKTVKRSNCIGDILSNFYYEDGKFLDLDKNCTLVAYPVEELKKVKEVIAIAAGINKRDAIMTVAREGYFKTLITDYDTAQAIYDKLLKIKGEIE